MTTTDRPCEFWPEKYWQAEAQEITEQVRPGMTQTEVRAVIVEVLGDLLGSSADGDGGLREQARRLDAVAKVVVAALG